MRSPAALWARLSAMSWSEWPHRVREQVRRQADRWPQLPDGEDSPSWPVALDLSPALIQAAVTRSRALLADGIPVPGGRVPPGPRDWARDPITGVRWPTGHAFDVDVFQGTDPRASWSLHRLGHLQVLALASGSDPALAAACRAEVADWLAQHPPVTGLPWATGIEVASRAVSLLVVAHTVTRPGDPLAEALARGLAACRWYLARYPSVGSSANNHAVAELGARVLLGDRQAAAPFQTTLASMVGKDGSSAEAAPGYLAICVEWALLVRACGQLGDDTALRDAVQYLGGLLDQEGGAPLLGDHDGDAVLAGRPERLLYDVVGTAASALDRPELCPRGWRPGLRAALLGVGPCEGTRVPTSERLGEGMTRLVQGPAVAWLDTGRLGLPPMAAHGHADALAVWFHLAGRPILVDSGTGTYLSDPGWRRWARGAGAHNGLVVDGTDPLVQRGPFQWEAEPDDLWADRASDASSAEGRWTGWRGVRHHRRIELHSGRLEIVDRLDTDRVVEVAFPLHFAPDLALVETGGSHRVVRDGDPVCAIEVARPGLRARCVRGGDPVGPGWVSMRYGERVASTCLWVEGTVSGRWEGRTRLTF